MIRWLVTLGVILYLLLLLPAAAGSQRAFRADGATPAGAPRVDA